ncbi:MAG TPA: hypothetical protein VMX77_01555 [Candidatus Bathyarchaeia archaeon]|nr:hypothetical protein [Candidatus Bathyarchaeia archaeon]
MNEASPEAPVEKGEAGKRILEAVHKVYDRTIRETLGPAVQIPFTDRRISRSELWIGLPLASGVVFAAVDALPLAIIMKASDVVTHTPMLPGNQVALLGLALIGAGKGALTGAGVALGIEVMNGVRIASKKAAGLLHRAGDAVLGPKESKKS